ncbi:MAG: GspE/PulE family protein [Clostridium sp.]
MKSKKRLGDILVQSGKITHSDLINALKKQAITGKRLGELLIEDGLVSEDDILNVLEYQLGIQRIRIESAVIDEMAIRKVPEVVALKHNILPVKVEGNSLWVATSDPFNLMAIEDLRLVTGLNIEILLESKQVIADAIPDKYTKQNAEKVANDLVAKEREEKKVEEKLEDELSSSEVRNSPVVKLVDTIIENAIRMKASDIHVEPYDKYIRVRVRVDGQLQKILTIPKESQNTLITRIKILANLNIAEKRVPQDGRILTKQAGKEIDLRVSVLPTVNGEKVVIRILSRATELINKESLGLRKDDLVKLENILSNPYGIILVTGPTGSGKSTTLYAVLSELNTIDKNIITVEDPVEFMIEGINQVSVNTKAGLTFASGLRSILRQDPDVVMVGEIRDSETAEIAIRASITGHIVLSTLHTNDAPSTVARLIDMGIESYLVSTSVTGVIAQRLVRKVCTSCGEYCEATAHDKKILGIPREQPLMIKKAVGCPVCSGTGYKGRIGIYEIMEVTRELREAITNEETTDVVRDIALKGGMKNLRMACIEHVMDGITTMDELMRVAFLKE